MTQNGFIEIAKKIKHAQTFIKQMCATFRLKKKSRKLFHFRCLKLPLFQMRFLKLGHCVSAVKKKKWSRKSYSSPGVLCVFFSTPQMNWNALNFVRAQRGKNDDGATTSSLGSARWGKGGLIIEFFYISKKNVPNHYPEHYPTKKNEEYAQDSKLAHFLEMETKWKNSKRLSHL